MKNSIKSNFFYNGRGIGFDGEGSWSFGNDFARNYTTFGVDNSSSPHSYNRINNFLVLGEDPTDAINDSTGEAERKRINFSKASKKISLKFTIAMMIITSSSTQYTVISFTF